MSDVNQFNTEKLKRMTRDSWRLFEVQIGQVARAAGAKITKTTGSRRETTIIESDEAFANKQGPNQKNVTPEMFVTWGKNYITKLKQENSPEVISLKESTQSLLLSLGVGEKLLFDNLSENREEVLEQLLGEVISVMALVFAWKSEDKIKFSQALGQIGVASLFAVSPLTGMIALGGLALGFNQMFHAEAFKKGGLLSIVGLGVASLFPGGMIVSFLAALVAVVMTNQYLKVDKSVEGQVKDLLEKIKLKTKYNPQPNPS